MRARLLTAPGLLLALTVLGACSGDDKADHSAAAGTAGATAGPPAAAPDAQAAVPTTAEVEFAYRCRGLLSAAWASSQALPAGEALAELAQIDMKTVTWWTGEASRRGHAAGLSKEQTAEYLRGTPRVLTSREKLEEVLPTIRECLAQTPK